MATDFDPKELQRKILDYLDRPGTSWSSLGRAVGLTGSHLGRVVQSAGGRELLGVRPATLALLARTVGYPLAADGRAGGRLLPPPGEKWDWASREQRPDVMRALLDEVAEAKEHLTCNHAMESYLLPDPMMDWFDMARLRSVQGWDEERIRSWHRQAGDYTKRLRAQKGKRTSREWVISREELFRVGAGREPGWVADAGDIIRAFGEVTAVGLVPDHWWAELRKAVRPLVGPRWHSFSVVNGELAVLYPQRDLALFTHDRDTVRAFRNAFDLVARSYVPQDGFGPRKKITPTRMRRSARDTVARLNTIRDEAQPFANTPEGSRGEVARLREYFRNAW